VAHVRQEAALRTVGFDRLLARAVGFVCALVDEPFQIQVHALYLSRASTRLEREVRDERHGAGQQRADE
jgi:hypothetical protein